MSTRPPSQETAVQRAVRLSLGQRDDTVLWRNNVGTAVFERAGVRYPVAYGLCNGSSDLIGLYRCRAMLLTPDGRWVETTVGRFVAIEVKDRGKTSDDQDHFLNLVRRMGGIAGVARSPDEANALIEAQGGPSE